MLAGGHDDDDDDDDAEQGNKRKERSDSHPRGWLNYTHLNHFLILD